MGLKTPLYDQHCALGGKMVDFAGWDMPLHYGSQLQEHHFVRQDAGVFDVSHMAAIDILGEGASDFLRYLLANDVAKLKLPRKALYSCMLNEQGGVIDDLIVYFCAPQHYRVIVNAGTRVKDTAWLQRQAKHFAITLKPVTDVVLLAIQGPNARAKTASILSPKQAEAMLALQPFECLPFEDTFIARTGYTGEDGLEVLLPTHLALSFWQKLLGADVKPCGLGARDTLRLEAGLNLYGQDMDEKTSPLESNLAWTVAWQPADRQFIGRSALEQQQQQGISQRLVGLVLAERGVLRHGQSVIVDGIGNGEITSGSFSPTLGVGIALARVPAATGQQCWIEMRGKRISAHVIKPPFVRQGKKAFTLEARINQHESQHTH